MEQTAVEWLEEQLDSELELYNSQWLRIEKIIDQAKEMEKKQIIDAFKEGYNDSRTPKQYYNETFKNK